jgi:DNA polymerase III epsilon subunit-like protein
MSTNTPWIFVDCEARGTSPVHGVLTEFGAVHYDTRDSFHGRLYDATPDPDNPAISIVGERLASDTEVAERFAAWLRDHLGGRRPVFVSDNPAYDWQWIAGMFDRAGLENPFGHSGRRVGDFWAGLNRNCSDTQGWKRFRKTPHDHNPVNDAMGNVEAFEEIMRRVKASSVAADSAE